ncbi:unnamed protein product [Victoria cruziana]
MFWSSSSSDLMVKKRGSLRRAAADHKDACPKAVQVNRAHPVCCVCGDDLHEEPDSAVIDYCNCSGRPASVHAACISSLVSGDLEKSKFCEICGKKELVDGRDCIAVKMPSKVETELPRIIVPDLNWKTDTKAPKGNKRAIRRARTALTGSLKKSPTAGSLSSVEDSKDNVSNKMEEAPASESEKLGVSLSGRRFNDAVVSVPIKKRRIPVVRSPSPPPETPPHSADQALKEQSFSEAEESSVYSSRDLSILVDGGADELLKINNTTEKEENVYHSEPEMEEEDVTAEHVSPSERCTDTVDFSGISILAAAACKSEPGSSVGRFGTLSERLPSSDDKHANPAGIENELPSEQSESRELNCRHVQVLSNNALVDDGMRKEDDGMRGECDAHQKDGGGISEGHDKSSLDEKGKREKPDSFSRVDRTSWDLNTVMDEWESSSDDIAIGQCEPNKLKVGSQEVAKMGRVGQGKLAGEMFAEGNRQLDNRFVDTGKNVSLRLGAAEIPQMHEHLESGLGSCSSKDLNDHPSLRMESSLGENPISTMRKPELVPLETEVSAESPFHCHNRPVDYKSESDVIECPIKDVAVVEGNEQAMSTIITDIGSGSSALEEHPDNADKAGIDTSLIASNTIGTDEENENGCILDVEDHAQGEGAVEGDVGLVSGTTSTTDGKHVSPEREKYPNAQGIMFTDSGLSCSPLKHVPAHQGASDLKYDNEVERSVPETSSPSENDSCVGFAEKNPVDDDAKQLITSNGGDALAEHAMNSNSDQDGYNGLVNSPKIEKTSGVVIPGNSFIIVEHNPNIVGDSPMKECSGEIKKVANFREIKDEQNDDSHGDVEFLSDELCSRKQEKQHHAVAHGDTESSGLQDGTQKILTSAVTQQNPVEKDSTLNHFSSFAEASKHQIDEHVNLSTEDAQGGDKGHNCASDGSQEVPKVAATGTGMENEPHGDDDSQYEDGEFRDLVVAGWDDDTVEDMEIDDVDYGYSDNRDIDDFGMTMDDPNAESLQVESLDSKGKVPLESFSSANSEGATFAEKNVKEATVGTDQPIQAEGSDTGSVHNRSMFRKVSKGHDGSDQDSGKFDGNNEVVQGSSGSWIESTTGKEACLEEGATMELGISDSPRTKLLQKDTLSIVHNNPGKDEVTEDGGTKRNGEVDVSDRATAGESLKMGESTSGRTLMSQVQGPVSSDTAVGRERIRAHRSRFDAYHETKQVGRDAGQGRGSSTRIHSRGKGGDWVDSTGSYWGPNRRRSPTRYGPGVGHMGQENAAAVAAAKLHSNGFVIAPDGTIVKAGGVRNNGRISGPHMRGALVRRGSPTDQEEHFGLGLPLGLEPVRDMNVGRGRSRGYVPRMIGLNPRERYHGPLDDRIGSSLHGDYHVRRRERSFSPGHRRTSPLSVSRSHTRSPRRSRTRSPRLWTSPRGRSAVVNDGEQSLHAHSRSPNFRSDARIERIRSPRRRPIFVEHLDDFVPSSRGRSSPSHASRWIDERRDVNQFREHEFRRPALGRNSPGRVFAQGGRRYDVLSSPRRVKADEYFRPDRSPGLDVDGRGRRYDISEDERKKHGERYGSDYPARAYDIDCDDRRFRYDMEEGFQGHSSRENAAEFHNRRGSPRDYSRNMERRLGDTSRRVSSREEGASHLRYGREGRSNPTFKRFGIGEGDMAPRRRRPS